ncbi:hypothetical protein SESBI_30488 [Sesbania bispinosa]|nr:hypothetical protein SESBI_30488 [Sesbania bispinosa]
MSNYPAIFFPVKEISPFLPFWWTKGTKIQGSIRKDIIHMRKLVMEEGHAYEISRVMVIPNEGPDRPTQHAFRQSWDAYIRVLNVDTLRIIRKSTWFSLKTDPTGEN